MQDKIDYLKERIDNISSIIGEEIIIVWEEEDVILENIIINNLKIEIINLLF